MKIKNLYIENEKRLKNLNINFENDEKILDVVVLAGVNGTGKTTVLEVIYDYFENFQNDKNKINIELDLEEENYINQNNISKETYLNNLIKDSIKKVKEKEQFVDFKFKKNNEIIFSI